MMFSQPVCKYLIILVSFLFIFYFLFIYFFFHSRSRVLVEITWVLLAMSTMSITLVFWPSYLLASLFQLFSIPCCLCLWYTINFFSIFTFSCFRVYADRAFLFWRFFEANQSHFDYEKLPSQIKSNRLHWNNQRSQFIGGWFRSVWLVGLGPLGQYNIFKFCPLSPITHITFYYQKKLFILPSVSFQQINLHF